jgi:hypothetical protein
LSEGEYLISHEACRGFYDERIPIGQPDIEYLGHILKAIREALKFQLEDNEREAIGAFLAHAFERGVLKTEEHLHLYLFSAWESSTLWAGEEPIVLSEKYLESDSAGGGSVFAKNIVSELRQRGMYLDIVGLTRPVHGELVVVEVKIGEVDDRAIGQILRYYEVARQICNRMYHECDIRRIRPVLIAERCSVARWRALPSMFREFLSIYYFRKRQGLLSLVDGRKALETEQRQLLAAGSLVL